MGRGGIVGIPLALPLPIRSRCTGGLLLHLQRKQLLWGQKGRVARGLHLAITRPLGAWSCHGEVSMEQSRRPPQPDHLRAQGLCQGQARTKRHRQHTQSAHGPRAPEKSQRAQETWHFQDWTPQRGPGHTARTFASSVQCSGTVSPYVPRRASDSLDAALHSLPTTAPGDRQQEEEMTVALCPPSPADSPTHFLCP